VVENLLGCSSLRDQAHFGLLHMPNSSTQWFGNKGSLLDIFHRTTLQIQSKSAKIHSTLQTITIHTLTGYLKKNTRVENITSRGHLTTESSFIKTVW